MRRALETAILVATGLHLDVEIKLTPILREQITLKNTVCSSVAEIKSYVTGLEARIGNDIVVPDMPRLESEDLSKPDYHINYSAIEGDDLWYLQMIRNPSIKELLLKVALQAEATERHVFDATKEFLLEMDQSGNELWKDRVPTNETKEELKTRLFDDEGVQSVIKKEAESAGRVLVVTHSNIVKNLLLSHPDEERDHLPKKDRIRFDNACVYPYQFTYYR